MPNKIITDLALPAFREKLILKISAATSFYQVRRFIETAVRSLINKPLNGYIIERFIEKLTAELRTRLSLAVEQSAEKNISYAIRLLQPAKAAKQEI